MEPCDKGYFEATVPEVGPDARYVYVLDGEKERPDPASRYQPDGVHQPSGIVDPDAFAWTDQRWTGLPLDEMIIYELHTGTFTREGTFEAVIPCLDYLKQEVGITALELMPVAQCPGTRNWGYDGVYPFAPQCSYGGPEGLKALVDACHAKGLAIVLDVVYNHLGPEGNYLGDFGPYFTDRYRTGWGQAINYDGPDSDEVRHYFISNALYWVTEYHIDALRLDAIHGIFDFSPHHILAELTQAVHEAADRLGRRALVIAESDLNDARVITPAAQGGHGLDAQWNDDFHHALHALLTGERTGYYQDFGRLEQLATAIQDGFVYTGQRSAYRRRRHGTSSRHCAPARLVVYAQNHDQVGNRARGDRLSALVPYDALKVAAATVLLAPNVPLLFMGEEHGEAAPFLYFTDHGDPALAEAVRKGRRAEFAGFGWNDIPDPQDPAAFEQSRVGLVPLEDRQRAALLRWYRRLLALRKSVKALGTVVSGARHHCAWGHERHRLLILHRWHEQGPAVLLLLSFGSDPVTVTLEKPCGTWRISLDAASEEFGGTGLQPAPPYLTIAERGTVIALPPYAAVLYLTAEGPVPAVAKGLGREATAVYNSDPDRRAEPALRAQPTSGAL